MKSADLCKQWHQGASCTYSDDGDDDATDKDNDDNGDNVKVINIYYENSVIIADQFV